LVIVSIFTIILGLIPALTVWTDHSFDKLSQIMQENPDANMPWPVALVAVIVTAGTLVILFNICMMFF
jgi:hypothetical protein